MDSERKLQSKEIFQAKDKQENEEIEANHTNDLSRHNSQSNQQNVQRTSKKYCEELKDSVKWNFQRLSDRLQAAEESRNWCHIPGSEHIHKDLSKDIEKLFEKKWLTPDMHGSWQKSMLRLHNKLEAQKQQWRIDAPWYFEDSEQLDENDDYEYNSEQLKEDKKYEHILVKHIDEDRMVDHAAYMKDVAIEK